jgi:hypothetical protein
MIFGLSGWYIYLSFIDWCIHKHVLHYKGVNDWRSTLRATHIRHHTAHLGQNADEGVTFDYTEASVIAMVTALPLLILGWKYILAHIILVFLGVGVHNYSHRAFHDVSKPILGPSVPVPNVLLKILHNHHDIHHDHPTKNYCTAYLGFDYIAGTAHARH